MATQASTPKPTRSSITKSAAVAANDEALRLGILDVALGQLRVPDPAFNITIEQVAETIGAASSSIAYQFGPDNGREAVDEFRRMAYVRAIERFDGTVGNSAHAAVLDAARRGAPIADIIATLIDSMVEQLIKDPATRLVLGVPARAESNPAAAQAAEASWSALTAQVVDIIELVVASKQLTLTMQRLPLERLIRLALASGWSEQKILGTSTTLTVFGLNCSTATSLVWCSLAPNIVSQES